MRKETFNILLVEGVDGRHAELANYLRCDGYQVERLTNYALHPFAQHKNNPQLILLDLAVLAGSSLQDQFSALSRLTGKAKIPVVILAPDATFEFELLDVYDYLSEPIDLFRLEADIERVISSPPIQPGLITPGEADLELFRTFIDQHSGLHFSQRNSRILHQGLHRRMCAVGVENFSAYYDYLLRYSESRNELKKLLTLLTVGETSFFRYSNQREAFVKHLIPDLIKQRRHTRSLRIWSAGCSTGEEPYGVAILLAEQFPQLAGWKIEILATDINKRSLRVAREGIYGKRAVRLVEKNYLEKYFKQVGDLSVVNPEIKRRVRFEYLNLKDDLFPSRADKGGGIDLVFCRNVMIYFETETMRQIVDRFADCLNPGGYLLLGHSETLQNISERFKRQQYERAFLYQLPPERDAQKETAVSRTSSASVPLVKEREKADQRRDLPEKKAANSPLDPIRAMSQKKDFAEQLYQEAKRAFNHEEFAAAEEAYSSVLKLFPEHLGALIGKGLSSANCKEYDAARELCDQAEKVDDLCPDLYFIRGMISDMESKPAEAVVQYQKVLWLDPCFIVAHYALSRLYRQGGDLSSARRALLNTIRCLEKMSPSTRVHFSGGMTREVFLELCRNDLDTFAD
ncbi:MAG: tetratricopeptide repeat protein [Desulfuromonadales bacterium]|nr:tetratricopeptide repeat protein [Desulfuromonadales bacterium]